MVFFIFVFAIVELGRGLMINYLLINTARQACRVGVPAGRSTANIQSAATTALQRSGLPQATVTVLVNGAAADANTAQSGDQITVSVTTPLSQVTWMPGTRYLPATLGGSYSLRRE
jgi:Flp pilus assembly protein TadG